MAFLFATSPAPIVRVTRTASSCSSFSGVRVSGVRLAARCLPYPSAGATRCWGARMGMERTFVAAKPDAVNRGLVGPIVTAFEAKGFKLVGLKAVVPSRELAESHYAALSAKPFFSALVSFICSGPVVAMVWEGKGVVAAARKLIGATNPLESDPATLRGSYGIDVGRNVVHGSDAVDTAEREIGLWFKPEELCEWEPTVLPWIYE